MSSPTHNSSLPYHLCEEFLFRLPLKSLTRFQSLSKHFFSFINSSYFISAHPSGSNPRPLLLLRLFHNPSSSNFSFKLLDDSSSIITDIPIPFLPDLLCFPKIIGSCRGLVCLDISPSYSSNLMLWNVGTRKYRTLPMPLILNDCPSFWMIRTGFGFNARVNDFKIVRIVYFNRIFYESPVVNVEVYSWKTGSWKILDQSVIENTLGFSCIINDGCKGVCINGVLYWSGLGIGEFDRDAYLVSFDMGSEQFSKIKILDLISDLCVKVVSLKGSVALASTLNWNEHGFDQIGFWVPDEEENDRTVLLLVSLRYTSGLACPLGVFNDSELVVKKMGPDGIKLLFIDIDTLSIRKMPICPVDYSCEVYSYEESLIPPNSAEIAEEPHE